MDPNGSPTPSRILLPFFALLLSLSSAATAQSKVEWMSTLDEGLAAAQGGNRVVLVDFFADWCKPCVEMDEKVWNDPALAALILERVVPVRIDFDAQKKVAQRFKVPAIPMMIWADPWGNEIGRQLGYTGAEELAGVIGVLPADFGPVRPFHELVSSGEEPPVPLVRIGAFYREKGLVLAADSFYERALKASKNGKKDPQAAEQAYVGLGMNALSRDEADEARKLFEKASKLPAGLNRPNALYGLIAAHARLGEKKKASARLAELRAAYPDYPNLGAAEDLVSGIAER